jgi:hypothetical protein
LRRFVPFDSVLCILFSLGLDQNVIELALVYVSTR